MANSDPVGFALKATPLAVIAGLPIAVAFFGWPAAGAFVGGGMLASASLLLARMAVRRSIRPDVHIASVQTRLGCLLMGKLPVLALAVYGAHLLGIVATGCFLAGYVLVYFFLLAGAILTGSAPSHCDEE